MPSWSPDGKKIVYLQDTAAGKALWLTDPDGKKNKQLLGSGINMEPSLCLETEIESLRNY